MAFATIAIMIDDTDLEVGATWDVDLTYRSASLVELDEVEFFEADGSLVSLTWQAFQTRYPTLSHQATVELVERVEIDHEDDALQTLFEAEYDEQRWESWCAE